MKTNTVNGLDPRYFEVLPGALGVSVLGTFDTFTSHRYRSMAYTVNMAGAGYPAGVLVRASGSIRDFLIRYDGSVMAFGDFDKPASTIPFYHSGSLGFPWLPDSCRGP